MSDPVPDLAVRDAAPSPLLEQLSTVVLSTQTVETAIDLVSSLAANTMPSVAGAGVTLIDERGKRTTSASDDLVRQADEVQYRLDAGPCLTAWRDQTLVRVDDVTQDPRWPEWAEKTLSLGVQSVLSTPLLVSGGALGAIKVYSHHPRAFGPEADHVLQLFARQAAVLLANVHSLTEAQETRGRIIEALDARDIIGQAKGVLIAQGAIDETAAFQMLVTLSQRTNRKLHDVAADLIGTTLERNAADSTRP